MINVIAYTFFVSYHGRIVTTACAHSIRSLGIIVFYRPPSPSVCVCVCVCVCTLGVYNAHVWCCVKCVFVLNSVLLVFQLCVMCVSGIVHSMLCDVCVGNRSLYAV